MKNYGSYPDHSSSVSEGFPETFAADDDGEGKSTRAAGARKHEKKKDRSPSPDSGLLVVAEVATTGAWTGEKKTKVESAPASARFDEPSDKVVHVDDPEKDWLKQVVGSDWDFNDLKLATDQYVKQLQRRPPFSYDMEKPDEQQLKELMSRLALYRIRAYKGVELKGLDEDQLRKNYPLHTLEAQGYYEWCESDLEWFFDPESFNYVGLEDYQRLVVRYHYYDCSDTKWDSFRKFRNTLEGDRQYVKFWEKLSSVTEWIEKPIKSRSCEWEKVKRIIYYQAVKIAADLPQMYSTLVDFGFEEFLWYIDYEYTFFRNYIWLYFEIWKRVCQQKMDLKEVVEQLSAEDLPFTCSLEISSEIRSKNSGAPGPVTYRYTNYLADISGELEESEAHSLVMRAIEKSIHNKWKLYYDYAIKKLEIAEKIGLISHQTEQKV